VKNGSKIFGLVASSIPDAGVAHGQHHEPADRRGFLLAA